MESKRKHLTLAAVTILLLSYCTSHDQKKTTLQDSAIKTEAVLPSDSQVKAKVIEESKSFASFVAKFSNQRTDTLDFNRIFGYETDDLKPIPDSIVTKYFKRPLTSQDKSKGLIDYRIYKK